MWYIAIKVPIIVYYQIIYKKKDERNIVCGRETKITIDGGGVNWTRKRSGRNMMQEVVKQIYIANFDSGGYQVRYFLSLNFQ